MSLHKELRFGVAIIAPALKLSDINFVINSLTRYRISLTALIICKIYNNTKCN